MNSLCMVHRLIIDIHESFFAQRAFDPSIILYGIRVLHHNKIKEISENVIIFKGIFYGIYCRDGR